MYFFCILVIVEMNDYLSFASKSQIYNIIVLIVLFSLIYTLKLPIYHFTCNFYVFFVSIFLIHMNGFSVYMIIVNLCLLWSIFVYYISFELYYIGYLCVSFLCFLEVHLIKTYVLYDLLFKTLLKLYMVCFRTFWGRKHIELYSFVFVLWLIRNFIDFFDIFR